jgi:hypothetical protein
MSKGTYSIWKLLQGLLFPLIILAIGVYVFVSSFGYKFITASFAGFFGGVLIVFTVALLLREIRRMVAEPASRPEAAPIEADQQTPSLIVPLAWCVGFLVVQLFIGVVLAIPIWVFVFLWVHRGSRVFTIIAPIVLWAIMKFGFEYGLETIFFKGILFGDKPPVFW